MSWQVKGHTQVEGKYAERRADKMEVCAVAGADEGMKGAREAEDKRRQEEEENRGIHRDEVAGN